MKTMKRFLALLLFFVAAMNVQNLSAQTNGDVNGDGVVDVADIAAVIKIMTNNGDIQKKYYWYVGQEAITADNYTTLAESSSTKYTTKNYTTEKYGKIYILTPDIVTSIKIFSVNANVYIAESKYSQDTTFNVPGYKLWVTSAMGAKAPQRYEYIY